VARSYAMGARAESVADTRDRIVAAATTLFLELPFDDVTLAGIAKASGVSHQTVLNHFGSRIGVVMAAAEELGRATAGARTATPGDVDAAIHALVGEYERIGDANVGWVAASDRYPELVPLLDGARAGHQQWLRDMFAAELPRHAVARRRTVLALHAATDVGTWRLLRRELHLSRAETERTIVDLVVGVLEGATP
jgi:AcrR family transcriptional regulator